MARYLLKAYDADNNLVDTIEATDENLESLTRTAEQEGFKVNIINVDPKSYADIFKGGLLQGLSLGTEDIIGEETDVKRQLEEAQSPLVYGAGKALGSLIPGGAAGVAGGLAGAKIGGTLGAAGGPIGALLGAAAGGGLASAAESYFSQPSDEERSVGEAAKEGGIAAALGLIPGMAVGKKLAKGAKGLIEEVAVPAARKGIMERAGVELAEQQKLYEAAVAKGKNLLKEFQQKSAKAATPDELPDLKDLTSESFKITKEYKSLMSEIQNIRNTLGAEKAKQFVIDLGFPIGAAEAMVGSIMGTAEEMYPEEGYSPPIKKKQKTGETITEKPMARGIRKGSL
jgi:hypothetical protein